MSSDRSIMVSIICTAYNHEKYIKKCLDGIVMQKTSFNYEVLINEDASTDSTAKIIREYERKYPKLIKPIYQTENQYSKGVKISANILFPKARGKYVAYCEGDDYWVDPLKLQKQVDALENNSNCSVCLCRVDVVEEDDSYSPRNKTRQYPLHYGVISSDKFIQILNPYLYQLSGIMVRYNDAKDFYTNMPRFRLVAGNVGDLPMLLYYTYLGDAYFINECLSHYRINAVGSWHSRQKGIEKQVLHLENMESMYREFDLYSEHKFHCECLRRIANIQLEKAKLTGDYKSIRARKNKGIYSSQSYKFKIKVWMYSLCPAIAKFIFGK